MSSYVCLIRPSTMSLSRINTNSFQPVESKLSKQNYNQLFHVQTAWWKISYAVKMWQKMLIANTAKKLWTKYWICFSPSPRGTQTHIQRVGDAIQPSRPLLSQCCPSCQCRRLRDVSLIPWSRRSSEGSAIPWTEEPCGLQSMGLQSRTWLNDLAACTGKVYPHRLPYLTDLLGSLTWMGIQTLFRASSPEQ